MRRQTIPLLLATLMMMVATASVAGPLDRIPDGRTNPAVDDMVRIPGVIGQAKTEACMLLQQAGLNPVVRMITAESNKHKGMECTVVKQSPLPGGVAMIGVSVKIDVYAPIDCVDQLPNDGYQEGYPGEEAPWPEGEEQNWTPDGNMEEWPESNAQPDGVTQQEEGEPIQNEQEPRQQIRQKKIDWKSIPRPSSEKPSAPASKSKRLKDRSPGPDAPFKHSESLIKE